jgi:hypothetical protein
LPPRVPLIDVVGGVVELVVGVLASVLIDSLRRPYEFPTKSVANVGASDESLSSEQYSVDEALKV